MEILSVIEAVAAVLFGGGFLALLQWLATRKSDKKKASAEADQADVETQKQQIDLGATFMEKMFEMTQKSLNFSEQASIQNTHLLDDIRKLTAEVGQIVRFLDGPYQNFKDGKTPKVEDETTPTETTEG